MTLVVTCHIVKCVIIINENYIKDYMFLKKLKIALLLRHAHSSTFPQSRIPSFIAFCYMLLHVSSTCYMFNRRYNRSFFLVSSDPNESCCTYRSHGASSKAAASPIQIVHI